MSPRRAVTVTARAQVTASERFAAEGELLLGELTDGLQHRVSGPSRVATRPAREGFYAKLEREVDPEGKLTPQERAKRVEWAMKAHMQRMALKSAKARRRNQ